MDHIADPCLIESLKESMFHCRQTRTKLHKQTFRVNTLLNLRPVFFILRVEYQRECSIYDFIHQHLERFRLHVKCEVQTFQCQVTQRSRRHSVFSDVRRLEPDT